MEIENKQAELMKKKEAIEKKVQEIFNEILQRYKLMIDEISNDHFNILDKVMKNEMNKKFDVNKTGNLFKEKLYEKIEKRFTNMWQDLDMTSNLVFLEVSKIESALYGSSEWRPAGLSAEDQVRPHIIKLLTKKKKFLQEQIAQQESQIAELVPQIESARKIFHSQSEKRARLLAQIQFDSKKIQETNDKIDELEDMENKSF